MVLNEKWWDFICFKLENDEIETIYNGYLWGRNSKLKDLDMFVLALLNLAIDAIRNENEFKYLGIGQEPGYCQISIVKNVVYVINCDEDEEYYEMEKSGLIENEEYIVKNSSRVMANVKDFAKRLIEDIEGQKQLIGKNYENLESAIRVLKIMIKDNVSNDESAIIEQYINSNMEN